MITKIIILNIFDKISEWFFRITSNISFKDQIIPFLLGIVVGAVLFGLLYIMFLFTSFKRNEKKSKGYVEIEDEKLKLVIQNSKNKYIEESSMKPLKDKSMDLRDISWDLINDLASCILPDSKYPLLELTPDEFLLLAHYITDRVDELLAGRFLRVFRTYKVSSIIKIYDIKKSFDENAAVKVAKKTGVTKVLGPILNTINPFYWFRKVFMEASIVKISNMIALDIIDIVGEETVKIYSKAIFNVEKDDSEKELKRLLNEEEE